MKKLSDVRFFPEIVCKTLRLSSIALANCGCIWSLFVQNLVSDKIFKNHFSAVVFSVIIGFQQKFIAELMIHLV